MFRFLASGFTRKAVEDLDPILQGMGLKLLAFKPTNESGTIFEDAMNLTMDPHPKRSHKSRHFMKKLTMYPHRVDSYVHSLNVALDYLQDTDISTGCIIDLADLRKRLAQL